jgi:mevalonate kinase
MTRWLAEPLSLPREKWLEYATRLEHRFHGRSSGMDVAVISAGEPISFSMERGARVIEVREVPRFTFHDTGLRCRTSECVLRVEKFREERPMVAMKVDEAMGQASRNALEGLIRGDRALIARAMHEAQECFYAWELVPGEAKRIQEDLLHQGALAAKLTGAGGGGMVVALWS